MAWPRDDEKLERVYAPIAEDSSAASLRGNM